MTTPIRILQVEDNPGDAELTREALSASRLHVSIDTVGDGQDALDYLRNVSPFENAPRPDLILLDLNLPRMDGGQVIAAIKEDPKLRSIPVVILTSSAAESDIVESYARGASCFVTKPVGLDEFQKIVRSVGDFWFTIVRLP